MAKAVTIVDAGGTGATNLAPLSGFGMPITPVAAGGMAVTTQAYYNTVIVSCCI